MGPDRWLRVQQLCNAALELDASKQAAFLQEACAGDEALRREVESLLVHQEHVERFIEVPALELAAQHLAHDRLHEGDEADLAMIGSTISHYHILERLGGGGMGVVYKAEDTKLRRFVALKFLPSYLATEPRALARLAREAQAASALNHPNICTIHEIGEETVQRFIVMEFMDGQTLKHTIEHRPLPLDLLLELGSHIADAVEAAHAAGIIHRDIKPANIFVTKRNQAKVLDFGLAKLISGLTAAEPLGAQSTAPTTGEQALTSSTGVAVGTIAFMSPEQLRGEELDARTDLFSFGAVLYEMATGQPAFGGDTTEQIRDAILNRAPIPPGQINPEVPAELDTVISRALEKDRNLRYQTAAEIRRDLHRLKRSRDLAQTPSPRLPSFPRMTLLGAAFLVVALGVSVWWAYSRKPHALSAMDTVVVADFTNATGDPVFDQTLKQGLIVQLEQSPFLSLVSDQRIRETLGLMRQPPDARLTPELARQVCMRTGAAAVLAGSIHAFGSQYVIGLDAWSCQSGESLASEQVQAARKEEVLRALGVTAKRLRQKLGESLASLKKFDMPVEQATTPSLEALHAYTLGRLSMRNGDFQAAIASLKRAIELDPNFAMAFASLGMSYSNFAEESLAAPNLRRAYELRERVSGRERFYIESRYLHQLKGDIEQARKVYELWHEEYPRDPTPLTDLSIIHGNLGKSAQALAEARESLQLDPESSEPYANLAFTYLQMGRLQEARAVAEKAQTKKFDSPHLRIFWYMLAFLEHDEVGMARQVAWCANKPGLDHFILQLEARRAASAGRLLKARELSRRASAFAEPAKDKEEAAEYEGEEALWEALFGNAREARHRLQSGLQNATGLGAKIAAALAAAFAGDVVRAQAIADDLSKNRPDDTLVQFYYLPTIRAQVALQHHDSAGAIEALQAAAPYELGDVAFPCYAAFVRGSANLSAHRGQEAGAAFQNIIDRPGLLREDPLTTLAWLGLARAYALEGDMAKARDAYQKVFVLWKDADSNLPVLREARAAFAEMK